MALTSQTITFYAGDTNTVSIPLKTEVNGAAFSPGSAYHLIFTAKTSNAASDLGAKFQYASGAGIVDPVVSSNASVTFHPVDTRDIGGKTLYWDIQAEHETTGVILTVAYGTLVLKRDTTRQTTTSVPLHTLSAAVPYTGPTGATGATGVQGPTGATGPTGPAGASSAPAGTTGSVQINTSGAFSADNGLVYTGTGNSGTLKIGGGQVYISTPTDTQNVSIGGGNTTLPFAALTSGKYNTSIGTGNFPLLTTGEKNVAIGTSVLSAVTTGSRNLAVGVNALANLTTGTGNTAIGDGASNNVTTGSDNLCINGSPASATNISSIAIGSTGDGSSTTVIGWAGNTPCTQTRLVGNTLILGHKTDSTLRTSIVQNASGSGKTLTLPNATGTIALTSEVPNDYEITSAYGRRLIASQKTVWPVSGSLAGILYFATTKVAAGTFTVRTTTGYARVIDHRGVLVTQVGTGNASSDITLALPQANVGQRAYAVISVANGGSVRSGDITRLTTVSNEVTVIDVASTTALTYLLCYGNQLTELDVSANTALTILDCNTNQLTTLDVSTNTALTNLTCGTNQLTALDVGANVLLTNLSCSTNQLTTLDVGANTLLTSLSCSDNLLPTAVVDQILVDLDALNVDGNGVYLGGTGNGAASATGIAAAAGLVTDGWTPVVYN